VRLIVDHFAYVARPGASARFVARRRLLRLAQARRRLLRLHRASECLGTLRGSSCGSSSTTSPHAGSYAARPGASARRASRRAAHRRLLRLVQAHRRLLRLHHASGCLSTSRGSSCGSWSTTLPTPHVQVPRHIARFVARLVIDYFAYAACPGASTSLAYRCQARAVSPLNFVTVGCPGSCHVPSHSVLRLDYSVPGRRDYLSRDNTGSTSSTPRIAATSSFDCIASTTHLD
jgi:hypothetical protein